ncbi:MAG: hypothetical protein QME96_15200, partial [Myxococcota bacterium]|nr:hypothetical protein [Myxococcota bacterium]
SADLAAARELLDRAAKMEGAAKQRESDERQARSSLATAAELLDELTVECARLDALVDAVRRAPSVAAREQLAVLGDLGPVSIAFPSEGAAIEIAFDGRPWTLASTGRQIVCDAWLRAGIRRALGMPWLGIWIDRVQDVGGQEIPALDGPVVLLRTVDEEGGALRAMTARTEAHFDPEVGTAP